jgi:hypothetical protein
MEQGHLHPAHLIAVTSDPTPDRTVEVLASGAHLCLRKGLLYPDDGIRFQHLVVTPPPVNILPDGVTPQMRQIVRNTALQALYLDHHKQTMTPLERQRRIQHELPTLTWSVVETEKLILDPYKLTEPYKRWFLLQGDLTLVYQALRQALLRHQSTAHLVPVLEAMLRYPDSSNQGAKQCGMSRTTYYDHRLRLLEVVADLLNAPPETLWDDERLDVQSVH